MTTPPAELQIYLDVAASQPTDRFRGALLLPAGSDWTRVLVPPASQVFIPNPGGPQAYAGQFWSPVAAARLTRVPVAAGEMLEVRLDGIPTCFADWQAANFTAAELSNPAISGPTATPFGDGVSNLLRYALGVGPGQAARPALPQLRLDGGLPKFRFAFDPARFDLIYQVLASEDLTDWSAAQVIFDSVTTSVPPGMLEIADEAAGASRFYRLRVIRR